MARAKAVSVDITPAGMQPRKTPYLSAAQVPDYSPMGYARESLKVAGGLPPDAVAVKMKNQPQGEVTNRFGAVGPFLRTVKPTAAPEPVGRTEGETVDRARKRLYGQHNPGRAQIP